MMLHLLLISVVFTGCSRNKADVQLQQATEPIPQKIAECEVSLTESALRNSLLAPAENIKYSILKLHELKKDHHHDLITDQAGYVSEQGLKLLKNSVYITTHYLDSLIEYGTMTAVKANNLYARNHSLGATQINTSIGEMERLSNYINSLTNRKISIRDSVCMPMVSVLENQIRIYFSMLESGMALIGDVKDSHCIECLADEMAFYEGLIKDFREVLIKAPTSHYKMVSRSLSDMEHSFHELTTAHEQEEMEHSFETIERQLDRLEDELLEITGRNSF